MYVVHCGMQNSDIHRESQDMEENNGSKSIKTTYIVVLSKKQKANELFFLLQKSDITKWRFIGNVIFDEFVNQWFLGNTIITLGIT